MKAYPDSIRNAYRERDSLIILALTGRTGSGCSTLAGILKTDNFEKLNLHTPKSRDFNSRDERKYEVIYKYMKADGRWRPFSIIEASSVIFSYVIQNGYESLVNFFNQYKSINESNNIRISAHSELMKTLEGLSYIFNNKNFFDFEGALASDELIEAYYNFYLNQLPKMKHDFCEAIKDYTCHKEYVDKFSETRFVKSHLYTFFMQMIGNNIRSSGHPYLNNYTEKNYYNVAERIDNIIKIIKAYNRKHNIDVTRICIDAIRNPYEAYYFKDRYSSFYLVSINAEESDRKKRLGNLDADELHSLDNIEYEKVSNSEYDIFYHQNMQECLAISDIHLYNSQSDDKKFYFLTEQIIRYICLMLHPGLICPSHLERCMQIAGIARLNSGCLSRQVGAVITGEDYSIKAVGWNEVPEGQVPCNLRCVSDYCSNKDFETYSSYELKNKEFEETIFNVNSALSNVDLHGMSYAYCFKDVYCGLTKTKNQVHTRALHAEENAFLQISKNGGQGIKGGKLFTTASPCELCAKKAFQLGIKDIYYIDPYPGISAKHILDFGSVLAPKMHVFYGAIGNAYVKLYTPRIPLKDELKLLTGVDCKQIINKNDSDKIKQLEVQDVKLKNQECTFIFKSRTEIKEITNSTLEALHDNIKTVPHKVYWTGSAFNGFKLTDCDKKHFFNDSVQIQKSPYIASIELETPLNAGETVRYEIEIEAKDTKRIMSPYYAQLITKKTDCLTLCVKAPKGLLKDVYFVLYADLNMSKEYQIEEKNITPDIESDYEVFTARVDNPNLLYSYCIEWKFND